MKNRGVMLHNKRKETGEKQPPVTVGDEAVRQRLLNEAVHLFSPLNSCLYILAHRSIDEWHRHRLPGGVSLILTGDWPGGREHSSRRFEEGWRVSRDNTRSH